jgi:hypothetical protein
VVVEERKFALLLFLPFSYAIPTKKSSSVALCSSVFSVFVFLLALLKPGNLERLLFGIAFAILPRSVFICSAPADNEVTHFSYDYD